MSHFHGHIRWKIFICSSIYTPSVSPIELTVPALFAQRLEITNCPIHFSAKCIDRHGDLSAFHWGNGLTLKVKFKVTFSPNGYVAGVHHNLNQHAKKYVPLYNYLSASAL